MNKIILEDRFTSHQKITFLLYMGAPFILGIISVLRNYWLSTEHYLIIALCMIAYFLLISIAFLKRGFIKINNHLYKASFFSGRLFFKSKIDISKTPKIAVLSFKKSQKLAWFSAARPDLATTFYSYEINILNDRHTKRTPILILKNKKNVEGTVQFLTSNFDLEKEKNRPRFR